MQWGPRKECQVPQQLPAMPAPETVQVQRGVRAAGPVDTSVPVPDEEYCGCTFCGTEKLDRVSWQAETSRAQTTSPKPI